MSEAEGKPSWYETGYTGTKREEDRIASQHGPRRLYMKANESHQIVFVDDEPVCVHEHNPKINGSYLNWFTCLRGMWPDDAVCCQELGEKTRYYVGFYTIIDCTKVEWKGNTYQYEVKLLPAKLKGLKMLQLRKQDAGAMAGRMYRVTRLTDKSSNSGDDFSFLKEVDMAKLFAVANFKGKKLSELFAKAKDSPENLERLRQTFQIITNGSEVEQRLVPFNYMNLLKPRAPKDIAALLRGWKMEERTDTATDTTEGAAEEDVPF
jgi:hypothetical protein